MILVNMSKHKSFPSQPGLPQALQGRRGFLRDDAFTIDFEEFVIFWHVLCQTAEGFNMSFGELLFPGIVKKEILEPQGEEGELPPKPPEEDWAGIACAENAFVQSILQFAEGANP